MTNTANTAPEPAAGAIPNPLGVQPIKSMIWKFALPGIISQLVNAVYNIVDQIFIGWGVGDLGIAATTVVFPLATITTALSVLYGSGGAAKFSLALGAKEPEEARRAMGNALALMVLSGLVMSLVANLFMEPMLYAFGATDAILSYARPYARIISLGIPFGVFSAGVSYFIRADGNPNFSSLILLSGAVFNIIFDPIFLFVFDMGIEGIALATILGQILSSALGLAYLLGKLQNVKLTKGDLRPGRAMTGAICALGAASFTTHLLATIVQIVSANTLRHYGGLSSYGSEIPIAASGAVSKVMIVFMSCVIGMSLGCQPIYGYNYGSKRYGRVKETYLLALRYGSIIAVSAFVIVQIFPRQLLGIFGSGNALFYEFGVRYIRIYLFMLFANALQPITSMFFTSIGKANLGFWMALTKQGLLLIPLLLLLPMAFGIDGVFFAGPIADALAAAMVLVFARRELKTLDALGMGQGEAA